jgi:hypothetical protein
LLIFLFLTKYEYFNLLDKRGTVNWPHIERHVEPEEKIEETSASHILSESTPKMKPNVQEQLLLFTMDRRMIKQEVMDMMEEQEIKNRNSRR